MYKQMHYLRLSRKGMWHDTTKRSIAMECPKCGKDVDILQGNGKYPNSTYMCNKCRDDEFGNVFTKIIIVVAIILIIVATASVIFP